MSFDILESLNSALGGSITRQLGTALEESEDTVRSGVRALGPTMLAGLMHRATTPSGAADLLRAVNDEHIDSGIVGKLGGILGNRGSLESVRGLGESLTGTVFGNNSGAVTNAVSQVAGMRPGSVFSLLSFALPVVFGMLRKQVAAQGMDSSGLASLLSSQRRSLEKVGLDSRITTALGFGSLSSLLGAAPAVASAIPAYSSPPERQKVAPVYETTRKRGWLPWAVAASVAALAVLLMMNRGNERGVNQTAGTTQGVVSPEPAAPDRIRLASSEPTKVYFKSGEAAIDSVDREKIASIAQSAKGQDRNLAVTGYTDATGDMNHNLELAKDRADAVKDALVAEGVAESKIVMDPPATVTGSGTEDEARRVDIAVR